MSDQDLVCVCMTVTRGEIISAVNSGQTTLDQLKNTLMCCTGCGTCQAKVEAVMKEALAATNLDPAEKKEAS
jgi:NAD(P)H-nitrite reductase large subunit